MKRLHPHRLKNRSNHSFIIILGAIALVCRAISGWIKTPTALVSTPTLLLLLLSDLLI